MVIIMATRRSNSPFGDYHGTVGTVVLSEWKSIPVMRSCPTKRKKKGSIKQQQQNKLLGMVSSFLITAKDIINLAFQQPKLAKMTLYNAAVSYHMENAVFGNPDDPQLNLSKVKLSCPIHQTETVWNPGLFLEPGGKIIVTWEQNPFPQKCTQLSDKVNIVFYYADSGRFSLHRNSCVRSDSSYTYTVQHGKSGDEVYCYMFMLSQDGKLVSETEYLGMVSLTEGI